MVDDDEYLVEPKEPGPELKLGQKFLFTPGEYPGEPDPEYPPFVAGMIDDGAKVAQEQIRIEHEKVRRAWLQKREPLRGEWFVDDLYWELVEGHWLQNVVLTRQKSRRPR